jgi:signal-transduction protein with cAMP-binding, CBS, and nucleotidyltransferase domain
MCNWTIPRNTSTDCTAGNSEWKAPSGFCVEVWKDWGDSEADLLAVHGPGHLFGEMALIDELPRSATVIARNPVRVLSIGRQDFHRIITENASVALSVMRSVSSMVRVSNDNFVESLRKRNRELVKTNRQLKNTQSRLLRAERLSVLGRFSTLILHDIRNPISILRRTGSTGSAVSCWISPAVR